MIANIIRSVFGDKGVIGSIVEILKGSGVLKDPEQILKAQQVLAEIELKFMELETKAIESINATMREESKSEHFLQWSWRPIIGITFSAVILNNYILLSYLQPWGLKPIEIPPEIWNSMLVILGVSAGFRGWEKIEQAKNSRNNQKPSH